MPSPVMKRVLSCLVGSSGFLAVVGRAVAFGGAVTAQGYSSHDIVLSIMLVDDTVCSLDLYKSVTRWLYSSVIMVYVIELVTQLLCSSVIMFNVIGQEGEAR